MARHDEITKNNKQAISLQCFKKEVNDEVDFSDAGNQENFYMLMLRFLKEMVTHSQSSQNSKFAISLQ